MADQKEKTVWKYVVQHRRKDGIDEESFLKWYKETLMPICARILKKHDIAKFTVYYTPSNLRKPWQDQIEQLNNSNWEVPNWDVTTSYYLRHPEDMKKLHEDPEWNSQVGAAAAKWVSDTLHIAFGTETIYLDDGNIMNTTPAAD